MNIHTLGYNYSHDRDFVMERPDGPGCYLMLLIKEPALFEINGESFKVRKGSFVVFTPDMPCSYRADGDVYTDDWMYFTLTEEGKARFQELGIQFNTIVYLGRVDELSQLIHIMACEHYSTEIYHNEVERCYADILLMKISARIKCVAIERSQTLADKNYRFTHLRSRMYALPETITDVSSMAAEMGMSRSGFQHLYKRIFGVNVMQDITAARMEYGKQLLSSTNMSVKAIAEKCGYESEYSFMRRFRKIVGKTPSEYRKIK